MSCPPERGRKKHPRKMPGGQQAKKGKELATVKWAAALFAKSRLKSDKQ